MLKMIFKSKKGSVILTDIIILTCIMITIGVVFFNTMLPIMESSFEKQEIEIRALKGGGM